MIADFVAKDANFFLTSDFFDAQKRLETLEEAFSFFGKRGGRRKVELKAVPFLAKEVEAV